jgi:hypothetical protein
MNIFVGCSSRNTNNECYNRIAEKIGDFIVSGKHNFIFGGCETGLMGKIYSIVSKEKKSDIIVIISKAYEDDLKNLSYSKVYMFDTVNERKNAFIELADVMIFIPGGIGTVDELMTAIETRRNHEHSIPIIIINVNNFFGHLLHMLDQIYDEGFADSKNRQLYLVADTIDEAIKYLSDLSN